MDKNQMKAIKKLATNFREAIEKADKDFLPIYFKDFPRGSCLDASLLLACYLTERGYGPFNIVRAEVSDMANNTSKSHAWLEKDGLVIDITADQFADFLDKVIVSNAFDWHKTFNVDIVEEADIGEYEDGWRKNELIDAYNKILQYCS